VLDLSSAKGLVLENKSTGAATTVEDDDCEETYSIQHRLSVAITPRQDYTRVAVWTPELVKEVDLSHFFLHCCASGCIARR
jgi:hypothetical protein